MIRRGALFVEDVNAAIPAEVVPCTVRVPLVERKRVLAVDERQRGFRNPGRDGIALQAQGTV